MVKNSGFRMLSFALGYVPIGSLTLNGALACSYYNCAWQIHSTFFRGLRTLSLYERFRHENKHLRLKLTEMHGRLNNKFFLLPCHLLTCINY